MVVHQHLVASALGAAEGFLPPVHVDVEPIKPLAAEAAPAQEVGRPRRRLLSGFHEPAVPGVAEPEVHALAHAAALAGACGHVRDDARVALGELILLARAAPCRGADCDRLGGEARAAHGRNDAEPDDALGVEAPPRLLGLGGADPEEDGEEVAEGRRGLLLGCRL